MRRRDEHAKGDGWPENQFERLDLETFFSSGQPPEMISLLPMGWTLERARRLWAVVGHEFDEDCWAAREWGDR